ncbi:NUDIX domain containing protein [Nitzschia inconspicua]|uniref:NUDIX domain containing protein n=1 Tax=Nitzschia inconspicua TaxID=303405 RepID=A0A9K3L6R9_9STRA|nr:NUDIX domain containing protein [Nitzschia inconspicua]
MVVTSPLPSPVGPDDAATAAAVPSVTTASPAAATSDGDATTTTTASLIPQVQVDMSQIVGRIKEAPVCVDARLKKEAMSAEELSKFCFGGGGVSSSGSSSNATTTLTLPTTPSTTTATGPGPVAAVGAAYEPSVVSSGSSTASRDSSDFSDLEGHATAIQSITTKVLSSVSPNPSWYLEARKEESERINHKITTQKISRNGRQTQRWHTDPSTQRMYRLTTGCIPVVEDGKILLVSSSRKPEWILPKGGWEMDEAMEESAIRETFEEAGVFGILGPVLGEIEYETRKAKKRRLEFEEVQRKAKKGNEAESPSQGPPKTIEEAQPAIVAGVSSAIETQHHKPTHDGDASSVASDLSQNYTHVKMKLFPLYVTDVRKSWPEEGRFRKAVHIDEAIRITESRPEFQAALKQLKERNLHLPQLAAPPPLPPKIQEPSPTADLTIR